MSFLWKLVEFVVGLVAPQILDGRRVRFLVHTAVFEGDTRPALFLNLTNLSRDREIEITHVWLATVPPVAALRDERPLPKRLKPDETWETWIFLEDVSDSYADSAVELARARLSTGKELTATKNAKVPPLGTVPGQ